MGGGRGEDGAATPAGAGETFSSKVLVACGEEEGGVGGVGGWVGVVISREDSGLRGQAAD